MRPPNDQHEQCDCGRNICTARDTELRTSSLKLGMKNLKGSVCSTRSLPTNITKETSFTPSSRPRRYELPPVPRRADFGEHYPDGGWGWVVCGATFLVHLFCHGYHLAAGTLYMELLDQFKAKKTHAVWYASLSYGFSILISPLLVAICRRKSPRLFAIIGGLVSALGCMFLSFSTELHQLLISNTIVVGLGTGVALNTASIMIGRYFFRRKECAEMLMLTGGGVGMSLYTVFFRQVMGLIGWMRCLQSVSGLMLVTVIAGSLYRSANLYHPRRRAIIHIKSLKKTKKQKREFQPLLPYFDFSPLRMRAVQILMLSSAAISFGLYAPFVLLPLSATDDAIKVNSVMLLMVFLGVAFACGCLLFGLLVTRNGLKCMIARQYLCQLSAFGCGLSTLLFTMATGFNAFSLYIWTYGLLCGGFSCCIKSYTSELVSLKLSESSWGYIALAQGIPTLLGPPVVMFINLTSSSGRAGYLFAGLCMVTGSIMLFFMPWAAKHRSNHEIIQAAHFKTRTGEDFMFLGMEVSDDVSSMQVNPSSRLRKKLINVPKMQLWLRDTQRYLDAHNDESWSEIETMPAVSSRDKVMEFLTRSQCMLRNYSVIHQIDLPEVKLEINKEYEDERGSDTNLHGCGEDIIKDIKLEATLCRTPPVHINIPNSMSVYDGAGTKQNGTVSFTSERCLQDRDFIHSQDCDTLHSGEKQTAV